jgi:hypothetical protein
MMDALAQLTNAARSDTTWPVVSSRKMVSIPCCAGMLASSLDYIRYNTGNEITTLCLRFVRPSDQKVYIGTFDDVYLKGLKLMGNDQKTIEAWIQICDSVLALSRECIVTFRHFSETVSFILYEEVDSVAEQIAQLKREHAAELEELRNKYELPYFEFGDNARSEFDDGPCIKKSRVVRSPYCQEDW